MDFASLGLADSLQRALENAGFKTPTPIQQKAIPPILAGHDLVGCAQTGTGKTAAFALPILQLLLQNPIPKKARPWIRALILTPTRELAAQISDHFAMFMERSRLRQAVIFGGVGQGNQVRAIEEGVDLLVATPGRLLDLIGQGHIDLSDVELFVLDEADQMLDMGFLPVVKKVVLKLPKERQTLLFSATMPAPIRELTKQILHQPVSIEVVPQGTVTDRVEQQVYFIDQAKKPALLAHVLATRAHGSTLVFSRTKYGADAIVRRLVKAGIAATALHGNKSQSNRRKSLEQFRSGHTDVMVATDIAARGIDINGIEYVINYDMPNVPETYLHRIGRTGRAGESGHAISFCNPEERAHLKQIEKVLKLKILVAKDAPEINLPPRPNRHH
jgi:ATP-dependent RNA helicase RhlE